jgi:hypothetical protein
MRHELVTQIDIQAAPEEIWRHLTAVEHYAEWNPFIVSGSGAPVVGTRLTLRLEPPGGRGTTMRPTVTEVDPGRTFEWLGHLGVPGLFDGRHRFELVAIDGGTRLIHREAFRGVLVRPLRRMLDGPTKAGFEAMNAALAERVGSPRAVT